MRHSQQLFAFRPVVTHGAFIIDRNHLSKSADQFMQELVIMMYCTWVHARVHLQIQHGMHAYANASHMGVFDHPAEQLLLYDPTLGRIRGRSAAVIGKQVANF